MFWKSSTNSPLGMHKILSIKLDHKKNDIRVNPLLDHVYNLFVPCV